MITGEAITANSIRIAEQPTRIGIPVRFNILSKQADVDFRALDPGFLPGEKSLKIDDLPSVAYSMFDNGEVLAQTLTGLNAGYDIRGIDTWQLQTGRKAYIMLHRTDANNPNYFVSYLAREPLGSSLDSEARADFRNLRELAQERDARMKPEFRDFFDVVRPFALGETGVVPGSNEQYSFFTMPLLEDYGEMHFDIEQFPFGITTPYFRYAYNVAPSMLAVNDRELELGPETVLNIMSKIGRETPAEHLQLIQMMSHDPGIQLLQKKVKSEFMGRLVNDLFGSVSYRRITRQREQVLTATGLIYHLSGGRMPKEFMYNSGDFMTILHENGDMQFQLITVRGGWSKPMTEIEWVERMLNHKELIRVRDTMQIGEAPFCFGVDPEDLLQVLANAKAMLN